MKWISVNTMRPALGQQVLCYYKGFRYDNLMYGGYRVLYYLKFHKDKRRRVFSDWSHWFSKFQEGETCWPVTHWAYLIPPNQELNLTDAD